MSDLKSCNNMGDRVSSICDRDELPGVHIKFIPQVQHKTVAPPRLTVPASRFHVDDAGTRQIASHTIFWVINRDRYRSAGPEFGGGYHVFVRVCNHSVTGH